MSRTFRKNFDESQTPKHEPYKRGRLRLSSYHIDFIESEI